MPFAAQILSGLNSVFCYLFRGTLVHNQQLICLHFFSSLSLHLVLIGLITVCLKRKTNVKLLDLCAHKVQVNISFIPPLGIFFVKIVKIRKNEPDFILTLNSSFKGAQCKTDIQYVCMDVITMHANVFY